MTVSQLITFKFVFLIGATASDYTITETNLTEESLREVKDLESTFADYMPRECRRDLCLGKTIDDPERGLFDWPDASIGQVVHVTCPHDVTSETNITCNLKNKKASWGRKLTAAISDCPKSYFTRQLDAVGEYLARNTTNDTITNAINLLWELLVDERFNVTVLAMKTVSQAISKTILVDLDPCVTLKMLEVAEVVLVADSSVVIKARVYYRKTVEYLMKADEHNFIMTSCPNSFLSITITEDRYIHHIPGRTKPRFPEAIIVEYSSQMEKASIMKDRFCSDGATFIVNGKPMTLLWTSNMSCGYVSESSTSVRCRCDIYRDKYGVELTKIITDNEFWRFPYVAELAIASYILGIISVVCLLLTVLTYLVFPHLRRERTPMILLNLCLSLLLLYAIFLLSELLTSSYHGCALANALRLYFLLASLIWNGVEGANMYLKLVRVLGSHISHFVWKAAAVAWGFPLIILGVAFACNIYIYHGEWEDCLYKCRLQRRAMMFVALLPMCVIIFTNLVVFSMVLRILAQRSRQLHLDNKRAMKVQLVGAIAMLTLLGVPWIFSCLGLIDVSGEKALGAFQLTCQVFFMVFTNLQGTFIFIFHCLRQQEVRMTWKKFAFSHLGKETSYELSTRLTSSNSPLKKVATLDGSPASSDAGLSTPPLTHRSNRESERY